MSRCHRAVLTTEQARQVEFLPAMRRSPQPSFWNVVHVLFVVAGLAMLTPPASAAVRTLNPGHFTTPGVPMYADEPDGVFFLCDLLLKCVTAEERNDGPSGNVLE